MSHEDKHAARFSAHRAEAEAHLWRMMEARGLHARDGWKIVETLRDARAGTELVIRPLHMTREAPADLECVIHFQDDNGMIDIHCSPPQRD